MARKSRKVDSQPADTFANSMATSTSSLTFTTWVYARISSDSEKADDSIDNQIALCKHYIHSNPELLMTGVFSDLGYSGTNFNRPGYADMLAGILAGDVRCVVVKDLSRLGRSYIEVGELLFNTFTQHSVRFISVNDNYDSFADDAGRKKLLLLFKNLVNHMYSRDLGKKIKAAADAKKERGEPLGNAPYGYRIDKKEKKLIVVPDEAQVVKLAFDMREQGNSIFAIARHLNLQKIPSPKQKTKRADKTSEHTQEIRTFWPETMINKMLRNEAYMGNLCQNKYEWNGKTAKKRPREEWKIHANAHEAIVTAEQFQKVAALLQARPGSFKKNVEKATEENRYAKKLFCTRCGKTVPRSNGGTPSKVRYYYSCRYCGIALRAELGIAKATTMPLITLDDMVMKLVQHHLDTLVNFDDLAEKLAAHDPFKELKSETQRKITQLQKKLGTYDTTLATAYTHHLGGILNLREYEFVRTNTEQEKTQTEARLVSLQSQMGKYGIEAILENQWLNQYRKFRNCQEPTKELIQSLIGRITLEPITNILNIELNFTNEFDQLNNLIHQRGGK